MWRIERLNSWFLTLWLVEINGLSTFGRSVKCPWSCTHQGSPCEALQLCPERTGSWLQINRLSLRNNRLKLETSGKLPIILWGIYRIKQKMYTSHKWKQNWKMSTCNQPVGFRITRILTNQWTGRFLGITGRDPSFCKSIRLQVDILRFSFIKLGYIL